MQWKGRKKQSQIFLPDQYLGAVYMNRVGSICQDDFDPGITWSESAGTGLAWIAEILACELNETKYNFKQARISAN